MDNRTHLPIMILLGLLTYPMGMSAANNGPYYEWTVEDYAITQPIGGLKGDPARGRQLAAGNCLACHAMPIPEEPSHGTVGPPLIHVASRLNEAQLRLRVVDEKFINPTSIMPGFYRNPRYFNRVLSGYEGKTLLTAQQVEDVVAYLVTLR
jgi:sulfur-oxidizing protein SoxX